MVNNISNPPNNIPQAVEWLIARVQRLQGQVTSLQSSSGGGGGSLAIGDTIGNSPTTFGLLYADFAAKLASSSVVQIVTSGLKIQSGSGLAIGTTGSAPTIGTATLSNGTVTVLTTSIATGDRVFLSLNTYTSNTPTSASYEAPVASIVNGTSFVINAIDTNGTIAGDDNSTINWWIIKPV